MVKEVAEVKTERVGRRRQSPSSCSRADRRCAPCLRQDALVQVTGGEATADRVEALWEEIKTKNRLDLSDQGLSDDMIGRLLKGLHMCVPAISAPDQPQPGGGESITTRELRDRHSLTHIILLMGAGRPPRCLAGSPRQTSLMSTSARSPSRSPSSTSQARRAAAAPRPLCHRAPAPSPPGRRRSHARAPQATRSRWRGSARSCSLRARRAATRR